MAKYEVKNIVILHDAQRYGPGDIIVLPEPAPEGLAEYLTLIEPDDPAGTKKGKRPATQPPDSPDAVTDETQTGAIQ